MSFMPIFLRLFISFFISSNFLSKLNCFKLHDLKRKKKIMMVVLMLIILEWVVHWG